MVTLSEWVQSWISWRSIRLRPSTIAGYEGNLRRYIAPSAAGSLPLDAVEPEDLIVLLSPIVAKGYTRQAQLVQVLVNAALQDACRRRLIDWNPMCCVDRIQHRSAETAWLTTEQAAKLLRTSREAGDPYYVAWLLGLVCGLRRGEMLGLRWDDVDLDAGVLHVRRQRMLVGGKMVEAPLKSLSSVRDLPMARAMCDQMRFLRRDGYVVGGTVSALYAALDGALGRAGLPRITLHGLRHSMAATAATSGVPIKILQGYMGHAQYTTTADVYAHVDRRAISAAAGTLATRLEIA